MSPISYEETNSGSENENSFQIVKRNIYLRSDSTTVTVQSVLFDIYSYGTYMGNMHLLGVIL